MTETADHLLRAVRAAADKLQRAEQERERAQRELQAVIRAAEAAGIRPSRIIRESRLPRATYYRTLRGSR